MIDLSTEFGRRVLNRLQTDRIIWLTTVRVDLTPQPTPVWFLWDGEAFLIFSRRERQKLRNISRHPKVALNFDGDSQGSDIVIFWGVASLDPDGPGEAERAAYIDKYREGLSGLQLTPEQFFDTYAVTIRVRPTNLRGH
jgi:PPOX class probable F420-dependent enzyme